MKLLLYTDPHFALTSSILNMKNGYEYSARLDLLVQSFRWLYNVAHTENVDAIICGGDLMDSDIIKPEEGSALAKALSYNKDIPEYFLLGNHEKKDDSGKFNSLALLQNYGNRKIIDKISYISPKKLGNIAFLPYNRDINSAYDELDKVPADVLISHMNFNGMNIGKSFVFDDGIDMDRILTNFKLVLNGHIHNAAKYADGKIVNIGSLFGTSFGDNYDNEYPGITILDTKTLDLVHIDNPYAVTFHTIKAESIADIINSLKKISIKKNPKCIRLEVPYAIREDAREYIESVSSKFNILNIRIIGKLESSTTLINFREESIEGFSSGTEALREYLDTLNESSLPSSKDKMVKFINSYLI